MIKSFKNTIEMGEQQTIRLSTNNGLTGYTVKKFQLISTAPGTHSAEFVAKLYAVEQDIVPGGTPANALVDFSDPQLLAVCYYQDEAAPHYPASADIIFDNVKFNQDIYITIADATGGTTAGNYYIELEQFKLDLNEATVATLKDMRGRE